MTWRCIWRACSVCLNPIAEIGTREGRQALHDLIVTKRHLFADGDI